MRQGQLKLFLWSKSPRSTRDTATNITVRQSKFRCGFLFHSRGIKDLHWLSRPASKMYWSSNMLKMRWKGNSMSFQGQPTRAKAAKGTGNGCQSSQPRIVTPEEPLDSISARSYSYFRQKTCHDLCRPQDREFWTSIVLRVGHDQPVIKQILIALGSLHESLEVAYTSWGDKEDQPLNIFSLEKSKAAIKQLKADDKNLTIDVVVVSCVLLLYFVTLQNDSRSAMNLLQSGLRLLPEWRAQSEVKDHIVRIFDRLRLQALTFFTEACREPNPQLLELSYAGQEIDDMSPSFPDFASAKACFESITEEAFRVMDTVLCTRDYPLTLKFLLRFRALLDLWFAKFNSFIIQHGLNGVQSRKNLVFLRVQYRVASLLTAASHVSGRIGFDKDPGGFRGILSDAATLLNLADVDQCRNTTEEGGQAQREDTDVSWTIRKHSVVPALLICAFLCRCPSLRRKAVTLLSVEDWCEPSWNKFAAEKAATWISATEEHEAKNPRTRHDVPQSCRIRLLKIVRLGQTLPTQGYEDAESGPNATVPNARGHVRIDLAFALESQRVLLRYITVLQALAYPI